MSKEKLVIGKDITRKEFNRLFEELKAANELLKDYVTEEEAQATDNFLHAYKPLTDEQIKEKILDPKYKRMQKNARDFYRKNQELFNLIISVKLPEELDTSHANLARCFFFEFDLSYMDPGKENEREKITRENIQKVNNLKDKNYRLAYYKKILHKIDELDLTKLYTGTMEERLNFIKDNFMTVIAAFGLSGDILPAMKNDGVTDPELLDIVVRKSDLCQAAASFKGIYELMKMDIYPLVEGQEVAPQILKSMADHMQSRFENLKGTNSAEVLEYVEKHRQYTKEELYEELNPGLKDKMVIELATEFPNSGFLQLYLRESHELGPVLKQISEAGALKYHMYDSNGQKLDAFHACMKMKDGGKVIFREHPLENVEEGKQPVESKAVVFEGLRKLSEDEIKYDQLNMDQKNAVADAWVSSLIDSLKADQGANFDVDNPFDTYRLHSISTKDTFTLDAPVESEIDSDQDVWGNQYGTVRGLDFHEKASKLGELSLPDKRYLYELAMSGRLLLHAKDGSPAKEKAIYVKKEGGAGLTDLRKIYLQDEELHKKVEQMQKEEPPKSFYEEVFPGASDAGFLTASYHKIYKAIENRNQDARKDPTKMAFLEQNAFQLYAIKDATENKEYYDGVDMGRNRMALLNRTVKDETASRYQVPVELLNDQKYREFDLKPEEVGTVYEKHPIGESMAVNKLLQTMEDRFKHFSSVLKTNLKNEDGKGYSYNKERPWEISEKIALDIKNGKNIYFQDAAENGGVYKFQLSPGKCKLKEVNMLSKEWQKRIKDWIDRNERNLSSYGTTSRDSKEFTKMYNKLKELKEYFGNPKELMDKDTFKGKMQELFDVSSAYFMAKLTEPQNGRRSGRFTVAESLRIGAKELMLESNAGNLENENYVAMVKEDILAAKAYKISDGNRFINPDVFWEEVNEYKKSDEFAMLQSKKIGAKETDSAETIAKKLQKAKKQVQKVRTDMEREIKIAQPGN